VLGTRHRWLDGPGEPDVGLVFSTWGGSTMSELAALQGALVQLEKNPGLDVGTALSPSSLQHQQLQFGGTSWKMLNRLGRLPPFSSLV